MMADEREGGAPEKFRNVFFQHYESIVRRLAALVSDRAAAEDLAQEVFLTLYRRPPEDGAKVAAWLYRVATNAAYDYLRGLRRERENARQEEARARSGTSLERSSEEALIENWEIEVVRGVLAKLSSRDREALIMKHEGYTYAEIADALQVNPKIVGSLLKRAAERFKKRYEMKEEGEHEQEQG